jgi:aryl-alcohol dehydrogenase-like predicted oxidoreductase
VKIGLGTAQFGLDYGIANRRGWLSRKEVQSILNCAIEHEIRVLDTSPCYGDCERRIGELKPTDARFSIVTKTPPLAGEVDAALHVESHLRKSLCRLDATAVHGLLVHRPEDLLGSRGAEIHEALCELRAAGTVSKIGVSVYSGAQIDAVLERHPIDLIQVPLSVVDQRLLDSGHLRALKEANIEVHVRSVFLQGLLFLDPAELPAHFEPFRGPLRNLAHAAEREGLTLLEAAIGFVRGLADVDLLICGVDSAAHLGQLVRAARRDVDPQLFRGFGIGDPRILDPSRWPAGVR